MAWICACRCVKWKILKTVLVPKWLVIAECFDCRKVYRFTKYGKREVNPNVNLHIVDGENQNGN